MNANTTNKVNEKQLSPPKNDWLSLTRKVWTSRRLILMVSAVGAVIGLVIGFGIPKEYTAKILIAPESTSKSSSAGINALAAMAGSRTNASTDQDAIYPSMYPAIIKSTPFLIRLFDVEVREQKDTTVLTLAQYLTEHQKAPWWSAFTSAPSKLLGWSLSLFSEKPKEGTTKIKKERDPFQLTRQEASIAGAIASRIKVGVDKKKRTITLFVSMQDALVAASVADTVRVHLQEYVTEYRTNKARHILNYYETLCAAAQTEYYKAQEQQARYQDANQNLVMRVSRAELIKLQYKTNQALVAYRSLEQQVQAAKARVMQVTPVYTVIQPVVVPLAPSRPRMLRILALYIALSGAAAVGWVLFGKDFMKVCKRVKNGSKGETKIDD